MDLAENYITDSNMQYRDTDCLINEFRFELSKMEGTCLDVGCGPGHVTKETLLPLLPDGAEIVGLDISPEMVNYARKKYADKRLSYIVLDIETLSLPNDNIEKFDYAVSFYCLHWCNDLKRAFNNIYNLLKPGGKALVMFLAEHVGFQAYEHLKENPRFQPYLQDAQRYVPYFQRMQCKNMKASLQKILQDIGYKILHCSNRNKSYKFLDKQSLKNHVKAINPFLKRFPDEEMKKEFLEELINEVMNQNVLNHERRSECDQIFQNQKDEKDSYLIFRYYILIAYVQKPSST